MDKSVVFLSGAALHLIALQRGEIIMEILLCDTLTIHWEIH